MDRDEDVGAFIAAALGEVCFGSEEAHPLEATTARAGFVAHIRMLRSLVAQGRIEVLETPGGGERIADVRHARCPGTPAPGGRGLPGRGRR